MIKPERMSRIAIVGPAKLLDKTIRVIYEMNLFHVVDFNEEDVEFKLGDPLPEASSLSQRLIRLRSIIRALKLDEIRPERKISVSEIERTSDQAIVTLELEVNQKVENRQNLSSRIHELDAQNEVLDMFGTIGLPFEVYSEYDTIAVFSGTAQSPISDMVEALGIPHELVETDVNEGTAIALFCRKDNSQAVSEILAAAGYQEIHPPFGTGTAQEHRRSNEEEIAKLERSLERAEEEITALREKYAPLVLAAEEHYSIEIQKAETPLRIATTQNSFIIDGWVPRSAYEQTKAEMADKMGDRVSVEDLSITHREETEEAPVRLKNSRLAKPFELFVELMSTPLYNEVDPTIFVFAVFPLFFGLMIGDFGYGLGLLFVGWLMYSKWGRESDAVRKLSQIVMAGGIFACIFGLLLFGEAFGLPFHAPPEHPDEPSWVFLFNFPLHPVMEKLIDVKEYLVLSVVAAWIHMSIGLVLGFFNELSHDRKHATVKILWLILLQGIFIQMLFVARWTEIGGFFFEFMGAPIADYGMPFAGMTLSFVAVGLIGAPAIGFFVVLGKAGAMEFMEILSMVTNVISYTRLAGIGVAKGAMALAFNSIVIDNFLGGGIILIIVGVVVLVLLQLLVFALGSISSGIQALRLNYVEFFLKFFKGGGVEFEPLGYRRKFSISKTEV
ncbi:MAG TPA: V-type ATP synthase subunit I [Euryarchaeota archaeon]|mgnify:CR=1 FL=1|nr:V-type ATP synthase subunit I [Euryarchaeota archaeon]